MRTITDLQNLDDQREAWEWKHGDWDFHCGYETVLGAWVLEQFDSRVKNAQQAHLAEFECESLQDAFAVLA